MYKRFNYDNGELMGVCKNTKDGIITVNSYKVDLDNVLGWNEYFTEENGYYKTTKKVFDQVYNQTIEKIKKANS